MGGLMRTGTPPGCVTTNTGKQTEQKLNGIAAQVNITCEGDRAATIELLLP